jgi:hypothetical protein
MTRKSVGILTPYSKTYFESPDTQEVKVKIFILLAALLTLSISCSRNSENMDTDAGTGSASGPMKETGSAGGNR